MCITFAGGQAFGPCLQTNRALSKLDLSNNGLGGQAAMVLARAMHVNHTLRELVLDGNALGRGGVRALLRCMVSETKHTASETDRRRDREEARSPASRHGARRRSSVRRASVASSQIAAGQDPRSISMVGCNAQVSQTMFEPSTPAGSYDLDLSNPYDAVRGVNDVRDVCQPPPPPPPPPLWSPLMP